MKPDVTATQTSYDAVAEEYAARIYGELAHKWLDRALLDRLAREVDPAAPVCDMGCGPGHVARYLRDRGVDVLGVDLSPSMVEIARRLNPDIPFRVGNMLALDVGDEAWSGIAAFYSIIHLSQEQVPLALCEFKRVLRPGGLLLLAFHIGDEVVHRDEWWEKRVSLDFRFLPTAVVVSHLESAGFQIEEAIERAPYADVEYQSRRAYLLARKLREKEA